MSGQSTLMHLLGKLAIIAFLSCLVLTVLALLNIVKITDGCFLRYTDDNGVISSSTDSLQSTVQLFASGNYTTTTNSKGTANVTLDPKSYGHWLNTNVIVSANTEIKLKISGDISLCRAYIPINNIETASNLVNGVKIPIPRVEEAGSPPVSLIFDATTDEWRNITEVFEKDRVVVSISPERKDDGVQVNDVLNNVIKAADCKEGKTLYSPICGKYSIYGGASVKSQVKVENGLCYTPINQKVPKSNPCIKCMPNDTSSGIDCSGDNCVTKPGCKKVDCIQNSDCPTLQDSSPATLDSNRNCNYTQTVQYKQPMGCGNYCADDGSNCAYSWKPTQYQDTYTSTDGSSTNTKVKVQNGLCFSIVYNTESEAMPCTKCAPINSSGKIDCSGADCATKSGCKSVSCSVNSDCKTIQGLNSPTYSNGNCNYTQSVPNQQLMGCGNNCKDDGSDCRYTWEPPQYQTLPANSAVANYVSSCSWDPKCIVKERGWCHTCVPVWQIDCSCGDGCRLDGSNCGWGCCWNDTRYDGCWTNVYSKSPEPYKNDGTYTFPWSDDITKLFNRTIDCKSNSGYDNSKSIPHSNFWYSSDTATGLLYRLDNNISITNPKSRGTQYAFAQISRDQSLYSNSANNTSNYKVILDNVITNSGVNYLQYRFHNNDGTFSNNTGGYVLNIKHTKCRRSNGEILSDSFVNRGMVQYVVVGNGMNPNTNTGGTLTVSNIIPKDVNGNADITPASNGELWLRILNDPNDYKDSMSQYSVQIFTSTANQQFGITILQPLFAGLKDRVTTAATTIFQNMTCYKGGTGYFLSCVNFFNYIKAILTLYIMLYGAMFLLGMTKINQTDLVIRVIKIGIVAGLMNGKTFNFFNDYIFSFVINFSDNIIADMSGYSLFTGGGTISNPFMFLDSLLSKIFFSQTFFAQLVALISLGISGILYFILVLIALVIVIITVFRAMAIYIMAFMAIAVLIGLAPLFLTFMLFDFTRYLFDNWVKFTIRYMLEPVVLMAGIIILTQLFTIYLDFVLGYSVCWKCVMPFKIPFAGSVMQAVGFNPAFANVPLFCINWFAPWGFDNFSGMMGLNLQHIIVLVIISYCLWGYTELSSKMVFKLTGTMGPSATNIGKGMSSAFENKALEQVGLDEKTRGQIKQAASQRLEGRKKAAATHNRGEAEQRKTGAEGTKPDDSEK